MTAFSAAAAVGVPLGLWLAHTFRWEVPFGVVGGLGIFIWAGLYRWLRPMKGHLAGQAAGWGPFLSLVRDANAGRALLFMAFMVFGHFSIIPLLAPHFVGNLGLPEPRLFLVYLVGGLMTVFSGPLIGRIADRNGRWKTLAVLMFIASGVTLAIGHSPRVPIWATVLLGGSFFVFASGRFIPAQAILSLAVPAARRGAFMSLASCMRDLAAGLTSVIGGWIVHETPSGGLEDFHWLAWMAVASGAVSLWVASTVRNVEDSLARS